MNLRLAAISSLLLLAAFILPLSATGQNAPSGHTGNSNQSGANSAAIPPAETAPLRGNAGNLPGVNLPELGATVALLPWSYRSGNNPALQSAREICNQLLLETGFNVFLTKSPTGVMPPAMPGSNASKQPESPFSHLLDQGRALLGQEAGNQANSLFVLPTLDQMTTIGGKTGTRYVLAGRAQWSRRNVWVGIAYRAKAICTVDVQILDTSTGRLVLDAKNVVGDSTENKSPFNTITSVIAMNPLPLMIPGSITPQQQRAVTVAIARAMEPWIKTERIKAALLQADESGAAVAALNGPTPKFSTLVTHLSDLQANMRVKVQDQQQVDAINADLGKIAALQDVTLEYKEPNRLRLSAVSPQDGQEALIVNEAQVVFTEPSRNILHQQDVSTAPEKRMSVLNFCGLLTPGMLDTLRARYTRQENLNGINTVVYDLSYWGIEDGGPFQRVWIDPDRHVILKRVVYDRAGKVTLVCLYEQPKEITTGIWLPTRVTIENDNQHIFAYFTVTKARIDQGIADSRFTVSEGEKAKSKPKFRLPFGLGGSTGSKSNAP
jgi:outer membrane lipoprotein-sorting protein